MIRNIRAPFRLVTCRPQFIHSAELWIALRLCLTWQTEERVFEQRDTSACTSRCWCLPREIIAPSRIVLFLSFHTTQSWFRGVYFPHVTHYCQNTWVNLVAGLETSESSAGQTWHFPQAQVDGMSKAYYTLKFKGVLAGLFFSCVSLCFSLRWRCLLDYVLLVHHLMQFVLNLWHQ